LVCATENNKKKRVVDSSLIKKKEIYLVKKISPPVSKSHMQRLLAAALMAKGITTIQNPGHSDDDKAAMGIVEALGGHLAYLEDGALEVKGSELDHGGTLEAGESGLSSRMFLTIASQSKETYILTGSGSLLERSFAGIMDIYRKGQVSFSMNQDKLPISFRGPLRSGFYDLDGSFSSQFISGLLMTLPVLKGDSEVKIKNPSSMGYLAMTLNVMESFGIQFTQTDNYHKIIIPGEQNYVAQRMTTEGDWSGGAFLLIAQYLGLFAEISGLSLESIQPDSNMISLLKPFGINHTSTDSRLKLWGELSSSLKLDLTHTPDLFPPLVLLALFSDGEHRFSGVHRLRGKESDRAYVMAGELAKAGAVLSVDQDDLVVLGKPQWKEALLNPHGDHRMAMLFGLIDALISPKITVENPECVSKSFPHFWDIINPS